MQPMKSRRLTLEPIGRHTGRSGPGASRVLANRSGVTGLVVLTTTGELTDPSPSALVRRAGHTHRPRRTTSPAPIEHCEAS
jgi:hypothetical protein